MVDKIITLDNEKNYVILDETILENKKYYFALRLDENDEPTNSYLFFEELNKDNDIFLTPIDKNKKGILLTTFTINFLDKVYDEVYDEV